MQRHVGRSGVKCMLGASGRIGSTGSAAHTLRVLRPRSVQQFQKHARPAAAPSISGVGGSVADATEPSAASASGATDTSSSSARASASSSATTSGGVHTQPLTSPRKEAQLTKAQYVEIYDRLIAIFQQRPRGDWKKLIVFSKQWTQHRQGLFDRVRELADKETDVSKKMEMRRLFRQLSGVDEEVVRYNNVLQRFLDASEEEWEAVVAEYRGDLQQGFFEHMACLVAAAKDGQPERREQLVAVNTRLLALVAAHDSVAARPEALEAAAEVYRDLLSSIQSVEDADRKMAALAESGRIDPAFLQITAKAYGAARDTNMKLDEAKWVAYRLYVRARDYFERQQPREKRILEYLVNIRDSAERSRQLDAAVTPGPTRFTDSHDYLYSSPARLYAVLDGTLRAFDAMQSAAAAQAAGGPGATTPRKVRAMRELRDEIRRRYM